MEGIVGWRLYQLLPLLLALTPFSLAYRDGARNESCYGHEIVHVNPAAPVQPSKIRCVGDCSYNVTVEAEVDANFDVLMDNVDISNLTCGAVYRITFREVDDVGYFIQARSYTDDFQRNTVIWGTFISGPISQEPIRYKPVHCGRNEATPTPAYPNSATHFNVYNGIEEVNIFWIAPTAAEIRENGGGSRLDIAFFYTVSSGLNTFYFPLKTSLMTIECLEITETTEAETTDVAEADTTGVAEADTTGVAEADTTGVAEADTTGVAEADTTGVAEAETTKSSSPNSSAAERATVPISAVTHIFLTMSVLIGLPTV